MANNNPSVDPANLGHLSGAFRTIVSKMMQGINTALPVQVIATDGTYVSLQPLIKIKGTSGETVSRAQLSKIPITKLGGGGFVINVPIQAGDQGWLIACDRDISLFLQNGNEAVPNTDRMRDFADGFFIPCVFRDYEIASDDANNVSIQAFDGSVKITLSEDTVTVNAPNIEAEATEEITVTAPIINVNASDTLNLNCNGFGFTGSAPRIIIDSPVPVQINNSVYVQGQIIATGDITGNSPIPPE